MSEIQPFTHPQSSPFDAIRRTRPDGSEYWSAREMQRVMGYSKWQDFVRAIERAIIAGRNSGINTDSAFVQVSQVMGAHNLGDQRRFDYELTRYACYLTAMNGDPRKAQIAEAQTYFAVKTREAETTPAPAKPMSELEMAQRYVAALKREQVLTAQVAELAPSADAWDTLASANGDYDVARAAQILSRDPGIQVGRDRLFTVMARMEWIYRGGDGRWRPYQRQVDLGRLMILPSSHYHPRTGELVLDAPQVRVTVKGLLELHRRLGGTRQLQITGADLVGSMTVATVATDALPANRQHGAA